VFESFTAFALPQTTPREFMVWFYLDDVLDDIRAGQYPWTYESLTASNFEETVRSEAKNFLDAFRQGNVG
jgi:hypothetical protein